MITLEKITAQYVVDEDRIAITGDGGSDGVVRLWLIRPLTEKLVSALANVVKPPQADERRAEAINAFAQSSAETRYQPSKPIEFVPSYGDNDAAAGNRQQVTAAESPSVAQASASAPPQDSSVRATNEWLIREMNLKISTNSFALIFHSVDGREAGCSYSEERLRQLLGILRRLCHKAKWICPDWPDWIKEPPRVQDRTSSFH